jgi:cytochrome c-type biogenesis protein CcmH
MTRAAWRAGVRWIAALLAASLAAAGTATVAAGAASADAQVYAIAKELMCPVCAGQTVAESSSALAAQMRQVIRERVQRGQGKEEILAYFVEQFGEQVLATPPRRGAGLALWLMPAAVLAVGLAILQRFVSRHRRPGRAAPPPPTPLDAARIAAELRDMD